MDRYHGVGGSYELDPVTGERRPKDGPAKPEPPGGGPRDETGEPLAKPDPAAKPEPALPKPARAPWDHPAAAAPAAPKKKGA
jgi:hypothetical protein